MKYYKFLAGSFILTASIISLLFSNSLAQEPQKSSRLDAYNKLRSVISNIEANYVDDIKINEIVDKAIAGLLSNLDAHSSYLTPKDYQDLKIQTDGEFTGIGIQIALKNGAITIISPIDGTPGDKAGLKAGDIILKINDQSTINMTIDDAVNIMRGKKNTIVKLTIIRNGETKPLIFDIKRDVINIESVYAKKIENTNYLYVRISSFDKKVYQEVESLIKKNNPKGIILDLRNNPGGLLVQAIGLSNLFIKEGIIVSQKGRLKNENGEFYADGEAPFSDIPLVVLVNAGSASASEIVAGTLQDHKRAVIIGENTFGKGSVQTVIQLSNNDALRLTTARYYLPSGRTIQAVGITPDIIVHPGAVPKNANDFEIKESDLKKHLQGELDKISNQNTATTPSAKVNKKDIITNEMIYNDIQLKSAIDALKTLNVVNQIQKSKTSKKK